MVLPVEEQKESTPSCFQPPKCVVLGLNLAYYFFHFTAFIVYYSDIKSANDDCGDIDIYRTCSTKSCHYYNSCNNRPEWCDSADPCSGAVSFCSSDHADRDDCGTANGVFMFNTSIAAWSITLFAILPYLLLICLEACCVDEGEDIQEFYDIVFGGTCLLKFGSAICIVMAVAAMLQAEDGIFTDATYFLCLVSLVLKLVNLVASTYFCMKCISEDEEEHRETETEIQPVGYDIEGHTTTVTGSGESPIQTAEEKRQPHGIEKTPNDSVSAPPAYAGSTKSKADRLREVKSLYEDGLINESDYEKQKDRILNEY